MKNAAAFVLAAVSAYAISFSADCFFGMLAKVYPSDNHWPVFTWGIIAMITGVLALDLAPHRKFLALPFALITLMATFGGIVGQRYDFAVAGVMLLASLCVWKLVAGVPKEPYDPWKELDDRKTGKDGPVKP